MGRMLDRRVNKPADALVAVLIARRLDTETRLDLMRVLEGTDASHALLCDEGDEEEAKPERLRNEERQSIALVCITAALGWLVQNWIERKHLNGLEVLTRVCCLNIAYTYQGNETSTLLAMPCKSDLSHSPPYTSQVLAQFYKVLCASCSEHGWKCLRRKALKALSSLPKTVVYLGLNEFANSLCRTMEQAAIESCCARKNEVHSNFITDITVTTRNNGTKNQNIAYCRNHYDWLEQQCFEDLPWLNIGLQGAECLRDASGGGDVGCLFEILIIIRLCLYRVSSSVTIQTPDAKLYTDDEGPQVNRFSKERRFADVVLSQIQAVPMTYNDQHELIELSLECITYCLHIMMTDRRSIYSRLHQVRYAQHFT